MMTNSSRGGGGERKNSPFSGRILACSFFYLFFFLSFLVSGTGSPEFIFSISNLNPVLPQKKSGLLRAQQQGHDREDEDDDGDEMALTAKWEGGFPFAHSQG